MIRRPWLLACPKTRMSSTRTSRMSSPSSSFKKNFITFAPSAWQSYMEGVDLKDWARAEARRYYHDVDNKTPFAHTYYALCEFADLSLTHEESATPLGRTRSRRASLTRDQALVSNFVSEGEQTAAESRLGRAQLNRILFREYSRWWDAFVAEADEDTTRGAPSASDRFSWHCAKMISHQTGLRAEAVAPVVAAWVLEHAE